MPDKAGTLKAVTDDQARHAMENGEFPNQIIASAPHVAVVLTQDWCPQWTSMQQWLDKGLFASDPGFDLEVYYLIYNRVPYFAQFLSFKERVWRNWLIPYVRYYRNGILTAESNYVSQQEFLRHYTEEAD
jgi:hypothetical protein